ncbi:MAG TPA: hypothetical protein VGI39_34165 [Polyangiaceae bacterium]|jgi:alpha-tubulin suppressor-like RCC1 family protein
MRALLAGLACALAACSALESYQEDTGGECGTGKPVCVLPNASASCVNFACVVSRCNDGYSDCDLAAANGCETNTARDPNNCEVCGRACRVSTEDNVLASVCDKACLAVCAPGFGDCDAEYANGCEANLSGDERNCGTCGNPCPGSCVNGECVAVIGIYGSASSTHACALLSTGTAKCWGNDGSGQLGDSATSCGTPCVKTSAQAVTSLAGTPLSGIATLATGGQHTCAIVGDGTVMCWGSNDHGQLGIGGADSGYHGVPYTVQAPAPTKFAALALGKAHSCALTDQGAVWCWGDNGAGQSGSDPSNATVPAPALVNGLPSIAALDAGIDFTCAVDSNGGVWCWGNDSNNQLGDGAGAKPAVFSPVRMSVGKTSAVSCGSTATCVLLGNAVSCTGLSAEGQLGLGSTTQVQVPTPADSTDGGAPTFSSLQLGADHACAIATDALESSYGALWCWGGNEHAQLFAPPPPSSFNVPLVVGAVDDTVQVLTGSNFTCVLTKVDGTVRCVGDDSLGQLGLGTGPDGDVHALPAVPVAGLL